MNKIDVPEAGRTPRQRGRRRRMVTLAMLGAVVMALVSAAPASALAYDYTNPTRVPSLSNPCSNHAVSANPPYSIVNIYNPQVAGEVLGTVELRWSTSCLTNWSRVTSSSSPRALGVVAWADRRYYDGANTWGHDGDGTTYWTSSAYSDQLYGNGITVCANGQIAYQSLQGGTAWTPTYSYCY
jgi:hypothetical protein